MSAQDSKFYFLLWIRPFVFVGSRLIGMAFSGWGLIFLFLGKPGQAIICAVIGLPILFFAFKFAARYDQRLLDLQPEDYSLELGGNGYGMRKRGKRR